MIPLYVFQIWLITPFCFLFYFLFFLEDKKQKNTGSKQQSNPITPKNEDKKGAIVSSSSSAPKSSAVTKKNSSTSSSKSSKKRSAVEAGLSSESEKKRRSPIKRKGGKIIDPVKDSWHGEFKIAIDSMVEKSKQKNYQGLKFSYFCEKVDEEKHQAPNYYNEIDHPMHFGLIQENLENRRYQTVNEVLL